MQTVHVALGDLDDEYRFGAAQGTTEPTGGTRAEGGPGNDLLVGNGDINALHGNDGNDRLVGGAGEEDLLDGGPGDDVVRGRDGRDMIDGGGGRDQLFGEGGADYLTDGDRDGAVPGAAPDPDLLDGGRERKHEVGFSADRVVYGQRTAPIVIDLARARTGGERGEGDRLLGFEAAAGGRGDDRLAGDSAANVLVGGPGRDRLIGRAGDDEFVPGTGAGSVSCGAGKMDRVLDPRSNLLPHA